MERTTAARFALGDGTDGTTTMANDDAPPAHTCPHCGGQTIWITRAGEQDVEGCPRCTQVGQLTDNHSEWLSGDVEIDEHEDED